MELIIMRHGATPGNERRQYVGILDHPLSAAGRVQAQEAGVIRTVKKVYVTSLTRTHQTAEICFPCAMQVQIDGLQEMNFGVFAGRSADEMSDDSAYRSWVDGMCKGQCPEGESRAEATDRICSALCMLLDEARTAGEKRVILVAHGGTIMSALSTYSTDQPERDYYDWLCGNCEGYQIEVSFASDRTPLFTQCRAFTSLDFLR